MQVEAGGQEVGYGEFSKNLPTAYLHVKQQSNFQEFEHCSFLTTYAVSLFGEFEF